MKVLIPSALRSYTESAHAEADGATLADVVAALDLQYPGIAFRMIDEQGRIRRHIRDAAGELVIVQALSGG
jgi:sulfur carrier protein ThiS